jgi:hypothetical protein
VAKHHLNDLDVIERRNAEGDGGWYVTDTATLMTLAGPFLSEWDARRSAVAIAAWAAARERPVPPYDAELAVGRASA